MKSILRLRVKMFSSKGGKKAQSEVREPERDTVASTDEECDPLLPHHGPLAVTDAPPASSRRRRPWLAEAGPVRCAQHQQQRSVKTTRSHKDVFMALRASLTWKHTNNCREMSQSAVGGRLALVIFLLSRRQGPSFLPSTFAGAFVPSPTGV